MIRDWLRMRHQRRMFEAWRVAVRRSHDLAVVQATMPVTSGALRDVLVIDMYRRVFGGLVDALARCPTGIGISVDEAERVAEQVLREMPR